MLLLNVVLLQCVTTDIKLSRSASLNSGKSSLPSPQSPSLSSPQSPSSPLVPRSSVAGSIDTDDPEDLARRHNRLMLDHYKKRLEEGNYTATRKANLVRYLNCTMYLVTSKKGTVEWFMNN